MKNEGYYNLSPTPVNDPENDKQIQDIISNPIYIYNIIKNMLWFIDKNNTDVDTLLSFPNTGANLNILLKI